MYFCHLRKKLDYIKIVLFDFEKIRAGYLKNQTVRNTVELQLLEHLQDHENMLETGVVRANES